MKKLTLLSIIPFAIIMADMNFPTSTQKGDSMSVVSAEAAPVNISGIIPNSTDLIWADMHDAPTGYPVATNSGIGYFKGPSFKGVLPYDKDEWGSINAWFQVEPATEDKKSCGLNKGSSVNTAVELSPIYAWTLLRDGTWTQWSFADTSMGGATHPSPHQLYKTNRGCNVAAIEEIRAETTDYNVRLSSNIFLPQHYRTYHGWSNKKYFVDKATIKAIYFVQYARLVQMDPNLPNDFHLAEFIFHGSSDQKQANGKWIPGREGWTVAGRNRYKTIPKNGDWMPNNYLDGVITKAELDANPPPFPKHP